MALEELSKEEFEKVLCMAVWLEKATSLPRQHHSEGSRPGHCIDAPGRAAETRLRPKVRVRLSRAGGAGSAQI